MTPQPGPAVASALCHRRPLLSLGSNPNLPPCPLCPDLSSRAGPPSAAPELYFKPVPPSPAPRDNEQQLGHLGRHSTSPGATPGRGFSLFVRMGMCPNLPPLQGRCRCQPEREHGDTQGNVGICVGTWGHIWEHGDVGTCMGTWVHSGEHKDTYVGMGTRVGTWGHRDTTDTAHGARRSRSRLCSKCFMDCEAGAG